VSKFDIWLSGLSADKAIAPPPAEGYGAFYPPYLQNTERVFFSETEMPFTQLFAVGSEFVPGWIQPPPTTPRTSLNFADASFQGHLVQLSRVQSSGLYAWLADKSAVNAETFTIRDGRDKPIEHSISFHQLNHYPEQVWFSGELFGSTVNVTADSDPFAGVARVRKTAKTWGLLMFGLRSNGQDTTTGAYAMIRPISVRGSFQFDNVIDYTDPTFYEFAVFEIGTVAEGVFSPVRQRIVPGIQFHVRAGLGRTNVLNADTRFCATAYASYGRGSIAYPLTFPWEPSTADQTMCGLFGTSATIPSIPNSGNAYFKVNVLSRGFVGQSPPALWLRSLDYGELCECAYFAGAVASPPYPNAAALAYPQNHLFNRAPEWGAWGESTFPYTLIGCSGGLRPQGKSIASSGGLSNPKTPVLAYRAYSDPQDNNIPFGVAQPHPIRTIDAKCVELSTTIRHTHFDDKAAFLLNETEHFVFEGKKITGLSVEFSPYLAQATQVPNGQFQPLSPPGQFDSFFQPSAGQPVGMSDPRLATSGVYEGLYWRATGSDTRPDGPDDLADTFPGLGVSGTTIYTGQWMPYVRAEDGGPLFVAAPAGNVGAETESAALLAREIQNVPIPLASSANAGSVYRAFVASSAPPTGSYTLEPFEFSGIPSGQGIFRFSGEGEWGASQSFTLNRLVDYGGPTGWVNSRTVREFQGIGVPERVIRFYRVATQAYRVTVPTTVSVSLRTDHVEFYAILGSELQESGQYVARPFFQITEPPAVSAEKIRQFNHDVWDNPKGKIREQVVYVDGQEPHALLTIRLRGRTAMRGEATVAVDASALPEFPGSYSDDPVEPYGSSVRGISALPGNVSDGSVFDRQHGFAQLDYTFNREQTLQLMAGQAVDLVGGVSGTDGVATMNFGVQFFSYRVRVTATVETE
jgi:hypothetical protein